MRSGSICAFRAVSGGAPDRCPTTRSVRRGRQLLGCPCAGRSAQTPTKTQTVAYLSSAELNVRIHSAPAESPQTIGSAGDFTRLIPIIQNNAGSIVKFLGNGVIATFGVARPSPAYAADAIVALGRVRCPGSLLFGMRGCHSPGTGRITALGSSWAQSTRIVQRKRQARAIMTVPAMAPFQVSEVVPGADLTTDDEILDWVKQAAETTYHPVGTCKMGADPSAVVDAQLRDMVLNAAT
jgi:GMC oxidoreductase